MISTMVYFIRNAETNHVKIGFTDRPLSDRLSELQTGCSHELKLIAWMHGDKAKESELHQRFERLHVRGEWFDPDEELKSFIYDIMVRTMLEWDKAKVEYETGMSWEQYQSHLLLTNPLTFEDALAKYESTDTN